MRPGAAGAVELMIGCNGILPIYSAFSREARTRNRGAADRPDSRGNAADVHNIVCNNIIYILFIFHNIIYIYRRGAGYINSVVVQG